MTPAQRGGALGRVLGILVLVAILLMGACSLVIQSTRQFAAGAGPNGSYIAELLVRDSTPVLPGALVDIRDSKGPRTVVRGARVLSVRWKIADGRYWPASPATGFVKLSLTGSQWKELEEGDVLSVHPAQTAP